MFQTKVTLNELLDAGVHFGHHPRRWHPKMRPYIYGTKTQVHIIDLRRTYVMLQRALDALCDVVSRGGRILFVGTKKQASDVVAQSAQQCGQHYVNTRWLGGTLTNWSTVQQSIVRMERIEKMLSDEKKVEALTKKERIIMERDLAKLEHSFGGLRNMGGLPDMVFILDAHKDMIAVHEARILKIPVVAIADTNADPTFIDYVIPGNDDARSAIALYCREVVAAVLQGLVAESERRQTDVVEPAESEAVEVSSVGGEDAQPRSTAKTDASNAQDDKTSGAVGDSDPVSQPQPAASEGAVAESAQVESAVKSLVKEKNVGTLTTSKAAAKESAVKSEPVAKSSAAAAKEPVAESKPAAKSSAAAAKEPVAESKPAAKSSVAAAKEPVAESKPAAKSSAAAAKEPVAESKPAAKSSAAAAKEPVAESKPAAKSSAAAAKEPVAESKPAAKSSAAAAKEPAAEKEPVQKVKATKNVDASPNESPAEKK